MFNLLNPTHNEEESNHNHTSLSSSSYYSDTSSVFKSFIGSNYLGVPYTFKLCGLLLSIPLLYIITIITRLGCNNIIKCKSELEKRGYYNMYNNVGYINDGISNLNATTPKKLSLLDNTNNTIPLHTINSPFCENQQNDIEHVDNHDSGYALIGLFIYNTKMQLLVKLMLVLTQFGFCCGYIIFLSSTLLDLNFIPELTHSLSVLILLPIVFCLSLLKDLTVLAPVNAFANFALLSGCLAVIVNNISVLSVNGVAPNLDVLSVYSLKNLPVAFGMSVNALEGIGLVIPLETEITKRQGRSEFLKMLDFAIFSVTTILAIFGLMGYLTYGVSIHDIIVADLPSSSIIVKILKTCLLFGILFTYPLQLFPITQILDSTLNNYIPSTNIVFILSRIIAVSFTVMVGIFLPSFHIISSFSGCIGGAALSFILPAMFTLKLFNPPMYSRIWFENVGMLIFGIVGSVAGLIINIESLI